MTIGRTVLVAPRVEPTPRLVAHEEEHVAQYAELGRARFLARYLAQYLRWRLRGRTHDAAYRRITFEVQAEWRARRRIGLGVVG